MTVGLEVGTERCQPQLGFFFSISPSWTHPLPAPPLPVHVTLSSLLFFLHHFSPFRRASFLSPPRFVYLRPAGQPFCCKETKIICWIFQKGETKIPRARSRAIFAEFAGSELVSLLLFFFYLNYSGLLGLFLY